MEPYFYREIEALEGAKEIIQLRACVCLCWNVTGGGGGGNLVPGAFPVLSILAGGHFSHPPKY